MMGLFRQTPRTPVETVRMVRDLLLYIDLNPNARESKRKEKLIELGHLIEDLKSILYATEPVLESCVQLTQEFFRENTFRLLIVHLQDLEPKSRDDVTLVVANLQRQQVHYRLIASEYLEANIDLMDFLLAGYEDDNLAVYCGNLIRSCIRHQSIARYVLGSEHLKKLLYYIQQPEFNISSDSLLTFRELLTRHKSTVIDFLSNHHDWFFAEFNSKLLEANSYYTRRQSVKLLGEILLLDKSNPSIMMRYISSVDNLRILMNLLRDSCRNIQIEAFHVFKLFIANKSRPPEITSILVKNKSKLIRLLNELVLEKEDKQFEEDKSLISKEIAALELRI